MNTLASSSQQLPSSKCYLTSAILPAPDSQTRRPYSTILNHPFNAQIDLLLTEEAWHAAGEGKTLAISNVTYHQIFMKLSDILEKNFYNTYIRQGNIILLTDGRIDTDDVFCLYDGILHMSLRKETYEKAGLVGKPARFKGKSKQRYIVEMNLRAPHMVHSKKSFKRLLWSAENVLNNNLAWLFCDLNQSAVTGLPDPSGLGDSVQYLKVPTKLVKIDPSITTSTDLLRLPKFEAPQALSISSELPKEYTTETFLEWTNDIHEWLALASISADRLSSTDGIDPLLSRYVIENPQELPLKITKVSWKGFIPASWAHKLFLTINATIPSDQWFSMTITGFVNTPISWCGRQHSVVAGGACGENLMIILRLPNLDGDMTHGGDNNDSALAMEPKSRRNRYLSWEVVGSHDEHS